MSKILEFIKKHIGMIKVYIYISIVAIIALIFINFIYAPIVVVGDSMNPALSNNDVVGVNMLADIERFDIVCFPYKYNLKTFYIKNIQLSIKSYLQKDTIYIYNLTYAKYNNNSTTTCSIKYSLSIWSISTFIF